MTLCPHEVHEAACATCRRIPLGDLGLAVFVARFDGRCGDCSQPVRPGDRCAYVDDQVVHERCAR